MSFAQIICADGEYGDKEPWECGVLGPRIPTLIPVRIQEHTAEHCFSACLYHEPTFKERFPQRDYRERYLERCAASGDEMLKEGCHLNIICDQASLDDALSIPVGSVFLCTEEPRGPFTKHLFRYYSPMLPAHPTVRYWHFRGMDNILKSPEEKKLIEQFSASGCDLLRSPYFPFKNKEYIRVKGSCSVNLRGGASLSHFLTTCSLRPLKGKMAFHCDEVHLDKWFRRDWEKLKVFTLIDRKLGKEFYRDLQEMIESGMDHHITVRKRIGGPMSSVK